MVGVGCRLSWLLSLFCLKQLADDPSLAPSPPTSQALLLGVVYAVDRAWAGKGLLPPWYLKMRLPLTLLAAGGLVMTAATS